MKIIEIVQSSDIEIKPFILNDFVQNEASGAIMEKITKKELKTLAESLGLVYDDTYIGFAKKLLNAYLSGKR